MRPTSISDTSVRYPVTLNHNHGRSVTRPRLATADPAMRDHWVMRGVLRSRFWLAAVSGFVNAVGFIVLFGAFLTGATGNVVHVGAALGDGAWSEAATFGLPILFLFLTASVALGTGYVLRRRGTEPVRLMMWAEIVALATLALAGAALHAEDGVTPFSLTYYTLLLLAVGSLGLQYSMVHLAGPPERVSTVVVGIHVIHGSTSAAQWIEARFRPVPPGVDPARAHELARTEAVAARRELVDHLAMIVSFAVGGLLGVVLERRIGLTSLVVPIVLLIVLALTRSALHRRRGGN